MRGSRSPLGLVALTAAFFVLAVGASSAQAAFGIADWEVVTCAVNSDTPVVPGEAGALAGLFPLPEDPNQCNKGTSDKWYKQAGGHPNFGVTDFTLNTLAVPTGFPDGAVKEIVIDTPEGLDVNPEATPVKCTVAQMLEEPKTPVPACPLASIVGFNYLTVATESPLAPGGCDKVPPVGPDNCVVARIKLPVYNVVPFDGVPSMVAFPTKNVGEPAFVVGDLDPTDQHITFTISGIHPPDATHPPIIGSRLVFNGKATTGFKESYLTLPTICGVPETAELHVTSHEGASDAESVTLPYTAEGCGKAELPFHVELAASSSGSTDSPEPATVDVQMPDQLKPLDPVANSHLLTAKVTLPEGAGLNPSLANGLTPCTEAQFKKGTDDPVECPASSHIGSIQVQTNALDQELEGDVYVAEPKNQEASSGEQFRVFLHAFNTRYGVNVRLIGHVRPNLQTGQLTVEVPNNPQAPFNSFKVNIDGGARGALTTPNTCGPHTTTAKFVPWARQSEEVPPESGNPQFSLTTLPGGGPCPKTLAERPFNPTYTAGPNGTKAGAFSPFELHITRPDGAQEIRQVKVNLPPGMVARLKGVEYCPEASIDAAASRSGKDELASPSCPASSLVGTTGIAAGAGPTPFKTDGKVYLAGPYKGAPISMVFVTPAVAGPYDLGTVVVRAAINIDPETAEVHAVSDPIPYVFGGVKLDIRAIDVSINRQNFTLNPTTCRQAFQISSGIFGGGGNPADPAQWFETKPSNDFRASECKALQFKPKFFARILGGKGHTQRADNPKFRATLEARKGDANLRRAAFILPRATILDQSHIKTICTRVQLAANQCPKNSIYGNAKATSPLLDKQLKGPVYLTSSDNPLPDLLVNLKGQVNIRLRGVISSEHGRLKTVFSNTPDVAVNRFTLTMKGGDKGLLVNTRNLCSRQTTTGFLNLKAQNSRRLKRNNLRLNIPACNGGKNS
jgi:hypothetical protein